MPVPPLPRRAFLRHSLAATLGAAMPATLGAQALLPPAPQDFGAAGNGLSDDSAAITRWVEHLIANNLTGYVPAGDYLMRRPVRMRLGAVARFGITGAGSAVSRFLVPPENPHGAFDIDAFNSRSHQLQLEGFSIIALGAADIGFRFLMPEGGNQHQRSLTAQDVWARSSDKRSHHFRTAFDFTGCWRPRLQNCGWDGPYIRVTDAETSARYACQTGFNLDGCYGISMEDCFSWGARVGVASRVFIGQIAGMSPAEGGVKVTLTDGPMPFSDKVRVRIRGTQSYDDTYVIKRLNAREFVITARWAGSETGRATIELGPESMNFKDNTINGVQTGILIERPNGREPTCWINGNHINYRDQGLVLDGIRILQMDQNNTYNEDADMSFGGVPVDIDLRNTSEYIIGAHVFHYDGHDRRIGIRVESDTPGEGDNGLIHHCIFSGAFHTGVHLTANATGVRVGPNLWPGKIRQRVRDDNGGNVIL